MKTAKKREKRRFCELSAVGSRGGHTLPNVARYQLRHTPIGESNQFFGQIRKWSDLWSKVFLQNKKTVERHGNARKAGVLRAFGGRPMRLPHVFRSGL